MSTPMSPVISTRRWREPLTLGDLLVRAAHTAADLQTGIVTPDERAPWSEVLTEAERLAAALAEQGVTTGSRVAVVADCSVEGVEMLFACAFLGAVAVPVNTRFTAPEICHVLADAQVEAVIVTDHPNAPADFPALVRDCAPDLPASADPTALHLPELPTLRLAAAVADHAVPGFYRLDRSERAEPTTVDARIGRLRDRVALRQTALIVYTSGTTTHPRGCPLTHEALTDVGIGVGRDRFGCSPDDVLWDVLPLFHLSFLLPLLAILDAGGTFVTDRRFDPARAIAQIRDQHVTVAFTCFPTVMDALLERSEFDDVFIGVRLMLNVGAPETLRALQTRAPHAVQITSYGCSEMGGIIATTHPDDPDEIRLGTNGMPLPGMEIATMEPSKDVLLPAGEIGEIVARGTGMFEGYWNEPESSNSAPSGWFRSGDLGLVDAAGRVSYRGRIKEMIKVGGENVSAMEIETVLTGHPDVVAAAVVAVPDEHYTEVPAAFVELQHGAQATTEDILAHSRRMLAGFKLPRHVRFVDEWPMSATKIKKSVLQQKLAAELKPSQTADS
jgi:acyl-CoA synthetase (AMP-forming)/AMP-acid ligase II